MPAPLPIRSIQVAQVLDPRGLLDPEKWLRLFNVCLDRLNAVLPTLAEDKRITVEVEQDFGNVAAGAQTTTTLGVENARMGDVVAVAFEYDLQAQQLTGYVSAQNLVTVVLRNGTAGAINLPSGALRVDVWRR